MGFPTQHSTRGRKTQWYCQAERSNGKAKQCGALSWQGIVRCAMAQSGMESQSNARQWRGIARHYLAKAMSRNECNGMEEYSFVWCGKAKATEKQIRKEGEKMKDIKIKVTLLQEMLGTSSANKEIHSEFIASKAPDAKSREEEVAAIGADAEFEKSMTVYPKTEDGTPFMWDYQMKGFFKDSCAALQRCKGESIAKESCKLKAYKKIIDGCIFVYPRRIMLDMHGGKVGVLQRPLRGQTAQGERIALASSETVPEGTTFECTIKCLSDEYENAVLEWLNYGQYKGLLQWRNAGFGRFEYEILM